MNKEKNSWVGLGKYSLALYVCTFLFFSVNARSEKSSLEQMSMAEMNQTDTLKETSEATNSMKVKTTNAQDSVTQDDEKPMVGVEQMPEYPGGLDALMKFLSKNVRYPEEASKLGIEGRVVVRFIVNKTGIVSDVEVIRGLDPACDQEAIRVIKMMPKWIPGKLKGRTVPVYFMLPIKYQLTDSGEEKILLVITDGVETKSTQREAMTNLKMEDIESISILKDSSAISSYGEKGKNGVIIIKKKK